MRSLSRIWSATHLHSVLKGMETLTNVQMMTVLSKRGRSLMEGWDTGGMETGQCENHWMMSVSER